MCGEGLKIGKAMYKTAREHAERGGGVFTYGAKQSGRKATNKRELVAAEWIERSEPTRRSNGAGATLRRVFGALKTQAEEIAKQFEISLSSALKYRPDCVVKRSKLKDLCIYCETLLKLRRKAIKMARDLGAEVEAIKADWGQNLARGPGRAAVQYLAAKKGELGDAGASLLLQIATLEEHENLVAILQNEMKAHVAQAVAKGGETVVIQYDFRSLLELHPVRGDSWDYYDYRKMNILGLAAHVPGQGNPIFLDVISPDLRHDSEAAAAALVEGTNHVLKNLAKRGEIKNMVYWADCGRHFRNRYVAFELLANNFLEIPNVDLRFVGENHGKSIVDGHFNWVGTVVKNALTNWEDPPKDLTNAIRAAAKRSKGKYQVVPIFLEDLELDHEPTMLEFKHVSARHKICRRGDDLFIEDTKIPKKTKWTQQTEQKRKRPRKAKPTSGEIVGKAENKFKKRRTLCC